MSNTLDSSKVVTVCRNGGFPIFRDVGSPSVVLDDKKSLEAGETRGHVGDTCPMREGSRGMCLTAALSILHIWGALTETSSALCILCTT
jgi:hypothetical protein